MRIAASIVAGLLVVLSLSGCNDRCEGCSSRYDDCNKAAKEECEAQVDFRKDMEQWKGIDDPKVQRICIAQYTLKCLTGSLSSLSEIPGLGEQK